MRGDVVLALSSKRRDGRDPAIAGHDPADRQQADHDYRRQTLLRRILTTPASIKKSTLAQAADVALDCSIDQEACSLGLAPTASTTAMLALGDALAVALSEKRGFKEEDFCTPPSGRQAGQEAGARFTTHAQRGSDTRVERATKMVDVIYEMSRKGLGITTVVEDNKLLGVISDGDLRRLLGKRKDVLSMTAGDCVTANPKTIGPEELPLGAEHHGTEEDYVAGGNTGGRDCRRNYPSA